jgi:RND family efflux transporter MFP subunit
MVKKTITLIVISSIILAAIIYFGFWGKGEPDYELVTVEKGNVVKEVLENGQVKKGDLLELSFNISGRIEKIYSTVGQTVSSGDQLAKLETREFEIQLNEAQANLKYYQSQLDRLLAGATPEEVRQAETTVRNAEISMTETQENLNNVKEKAEEDLTGDYEDALNTLNSTYLKVYNAYVTVKSIQENYFYYYDQESARVKEKKAFIQEEMERVESYLNLAQSSENYDDIDEALTKTKDSLSNIYQYLTIIRLSCDESIYKNTVSATDKTALDTEKTNINTALTNTISSHQIIENTRLTNKSNIATAQSNLTTAQGSLQTARDSLAVLTAEPQQSDIDSYQAQVEKAKSQYQLLLKQISDAYLKAPIAGEIAEINKKEGESVNSLTGEAMIKILPELPFEIEVNIYEEDVVKIEIGDRVDISMIALPEEDIKGEVVSISPAEKIIDNVVHYEVNISLEGIDGRIKPGMTADLAIRTDSREDVLVIPEDVVIEEKDKYFVKVFKEGEVEEREIVIGLEGTNDLVEVISGLSEGEQIIVEE